MSEHPPHLVSAARALERILNTRDPKHAWTVNIGPRNPDNTGRVARALPGNDDVTASGQHPDAVRDIDARTAAHAAYQDNLKKTA